VYKSRIQVLSQTNFITLMAICRQSLLYLTLTDAQITSKSDLENLVIINNGKELLP
jgi:hypothetical protein